MDFGWHLSTETALQEGPSTLNIHSTPTFFINRLKCYGRMNFFSFSGSTRKSQRGFGSSVLSISPTTHSLSSNSPGRGKLLFFPGQILILAISNFGTMPTSSGMGCWSQLHRLVLILVPERMNGTYRNWNEKHFAPSVMSSPP